MSCTRAKCVATVCALVLLSACGRIGVELLPPDKPAAGDDAGNAAVDAGMDGAGDPNFPDAASEPDARVGGDAGPPCPTACENAHGSADCSSGQCTLTCAIGYRDCDGSPANGCETSTADTLMSCGECSIACTNPNGSTMCGEGICTPVCNAGSSGDCDLDPQNGCEADLSTVQHCGSCDTPCSNEHGSTRCNAGSCAPTCDTGYDSCDGDLSNGCETYVDRDPMNCGACGVRCDTSFQTCVSGSCQVSLCPQGRGDCDANPADCETDLVSTLSHCGFCGNACSAANGTASCASSSCQVAGCNAGFANCDSVADNGCEASLNTSIAHCGGCANPCTNMHGSTSCSSGACMPTCTSGWGSCDGNPRNGCETQLNSVSHCGMCGRVCEDNVANATAACSAGICTNVCNDLSGVYALRLDVPTSWPANTYVRSGSGSLVFWARLVLTQSGTSLSGSVATCGRVTPDNQNAVVPETYGLVYPTALFDSALPTTAISGALGGTTPGASISLQRTALLMGVTMSDPINGAWPSLGQINATDHDGDGFRGVSLDYRSGGGYSYVPTDATLFPQRANRGYFSERLLFSLSGALSTCTGSSGSVTAQSFDFHTVGCRLSSGSQCSTSQFTHVDTYSPDFQTGTATYVLTKLAEPSGSVTCAQVRSALP